MVCDVVRGTVEDTELIDGMVFNQKSAGTGGPHKIEKAKIGLIQFCISPPKTDVSCRFLTTCLWLDFPNVFFSKVLLSNSVSSSVPNFCSDTHDLESAKCFLWFLELV